MGQIGGANASIKQLDDAAALAGTDSIIVQQGAVGVEVETKSTVSALQAFFGGLTGTIADNQVAFGNGTDIAGDTNFLWDGTTLTISGNEVVTAPLGVIYIDQASDFPNPLVAGDVYVVRQAVTFGNGDELVLPTSGACNIVSNAFNQGINMIYTGTGTFITGTDATLFIEDSILISTGTGTLWGVTGSVSDLAFINFIRCAAIGWDSLGTIDTGRFQAFFSAHVNCGSITLTDMSEIDILKGTYFNTVTTNSPLFIIDGTSDTTSSFSGVNVAALTGEFAFKIDNTLDGESSIRFFNNNVNGAGGVFDPTGVDQKDSRVIASGNDGIKDSQTLGESYLKTTQLVTIGTQGVPVVIAGVNWEDGELERVTATTAGRLTYTGKEAITVQISGLSTIAKVGGGADLLELCLFVNGSQVDHPCFGTENNAPTAVSVSAMFEIVTNDFFELFVVNQGSTANINVSAALIELIKA